MEEFDALSTALEDWFERSLTDLPDTLRQRVSQEFFPMPWGQLSADQRRSVALQLDYQHDPATEQERKFWWDFFQRIDALNKQVSDWEEVATPTATELALKESKLAELRREIAQMNDQKRYARGDYFPQRKLAQGNQVAPLVESDPAARYTAYPKAMQQLTARLRASPAELAAWIWSGPENGGIAAYLNANELDPPPRFFYAYCTGRQDYVAPLMACWFNEADLAKFDPVDRYIVGAALIERWAKRPGLHAEAFIRAKVAESRLLDIHPIYGGTRGTFSEHSDWPALETGLFALAQVEAIEAEDFGDRDEAKVTPDHSKIATTNNWKLLVQAEAARRWKVLRVSGANPTPHSIRDDLATWCREQGVSTKTGINPNAEYIYRHVLRNWIPPAD